MNRVQRAVIDKVGHLFGFSKRWSDAAWEWWHITYRAGRYRLVELYKRGVRALRYGDSGKKVKVLQGRLIAVLGKKNQQGVPKRGRDGRGYFGRATRRAVKAFQNRQGLSADGVVGQKTWRSLKRAVRRRKR